MPCPLQEECMQRGALYRLSLFAQETCTAHPLSARGSFKCTVVINQVPVTVLLNSGSMVTLVQSILVSEVEPMSPWVVCIHGDTRMYPQVSLRIITICITVD